MEVQPASPAPAANAPAPSPAPAPVAAQPAPAPVASWTDSLNPELKEYVSKKGFQDNAAVLESYRNMEKLQGVPRERILKLPETADASEWNEVYTKLGKPVSPDGYGLNTVEGEDSQFTDWAKNTFHKANLTTEQGQKVIEQFKEFSAAQEANEKADYTAKVQSQVATLQKEWGAAYNQNVARAQAAYRTFGLQDAAITALEKAMGFDGVMKFMHDLGTKIGEHSFVAGGSNSSFGEGAVLTPTQAQAKINALKQDNVFRERYLKGDVKAKEEMDRLHKMANP